MPKLLAGSQHVDGTFTFLQGEEVKNINLTSSILHSKRMNPFNQAVAWFLSVHVDGTLLSTPNGLYGKHCSGQCLLSGF